MGCKEHSNLPVALSTPAASPASPAATPCLAAYARSCAASLPWVQVPVQLRLSESEVSSLEQPPVLYVSCSSLKCCWREQRAPALERLRWCHWKLSFSTVQLTYPSFPKDLAHTTTLLPSLACIQFLVPRQSYLHSLVPQALQLLHHLLPPGENVPWFEHGRLPLKWCAAGAVGRGRSFEAAAAADSAQTAAVACSAQPRLPAAAGGSLQFLQHIHQLLLPPAVGSDLQGRACRCAV